MAAENIQSSSLTWLIFAMMTVFSWGVYGVLLHTGQMAMGDAANGRIKAFLFVGVAYLLTAVIGYTEICEITVDCIIDAVFSNIKIKRHNSPKSNE